RHRRHRGRFTLTARISLLGPVPARRRGRPISSGGATSEPASPRLSLSQISRPLQSIRGFTATVTGRAEGCNGGSLTRNHRPRHRNASPPGAAAPTLVRTADLLCRAREGDAEARNELFGRYRPQLERFLHARLSAPARGFLATQDLVQDACMKALT